MRGDSEPAAVPALRGEVRRRRLLTSGSLIAAFTGVSTVSGIDTSGAYAATDDQSLRGAYVPLAEKGVASGVATLDADSKLPSAQLPNLAARFVGRGELAANVRDYKLAGAVDDAAAITAAHAANKTVFYPMGDYSPGVSGNIYGVNYTNAIGPRWQAGKPGTPVSDAKPIVWLQKYTSADRPGEMPKEWDQNLYVQTVKESGAAYNAAITGYVRYQGGTGQAIGVHARASGYTADSEVFGMWAYAAAADPVIVPKSIIGLEIDMNNKGPDQGWMDGANIGNSRGLMVVGADNSNPLTQGISIGAGSSAQNGKFWTGLLMRPDGFMPTGPASGTSVGNGEAIRMAGATTGAGAYNGIRFRNGWFTVGVSFAEASYSSNAAILLKDDQRIVIGTGPSSSTYLTFNKAGSYANFNNLLIRVNGTQVVSTRRTGWGVFAGTATRTAFNTKSVTLPQLAERVKALIDDLKTHGLIGT
jgi:hypothetical protein